MQPEHCGTGGRPTGDFTSSQALVKKVVYHLWGHREATNEVNGGATGDFFDG